MCGIFGDVSFGCGYTPKFFLKTMVDGLRRLEYRGYDSSGIYVRSDDWQYLVKKVGNVNSLAEKIQTDLPGLPGITFENFLGISHTRWATHGQPTEENTHPHTSQDFVVVHNGIITNHVQLRLFLQEQGYVFGTDTDTEVIPMLCQYIYEQIPEVAFPTLIKHVMDRLEGSFAILVCSKRYSNELIGAKRGSPLHLGLKENGAKHFILASDQNAIVEHTNQTLTLHDNDILHIYDASFTIYNADDIVSREMGTIDTKLSEITKGPYPHFMLKEIFEQVRSVQGTMDGRFTQDGEIKLGGISEFIEEMMYSSRMMFIACGSSYHACLAVRPIFEFLTEMPICVENSCDFMDRNAHIFPNDVCIFVSQSGETADVIVALEMAKRRRALCVGITNVVGSTIDRETVCGIHLNAGTEIGVASTKAYTSQIVAMIMLSLALSKDSVKKSFIRGQISESLLAIPSSMNLMVSNNVSYDKLAEDMMQYRNIIFIGRSQNYATALEASLKLKEVAYIHCEGMIAGELKHGTLALIDENVLVIVIATNDGRMRTNVEQLKSRKARMIIVTDHPEEYLMYSDKIVVVPKVHPYLDPLVDIIPFQFVSYLIAVKKGYNVDQPRNLAKSVTVTD